MLIAVAAVATILMVLWLVLLGMVNNEDWIEAATIKILDNRQQMERLRRKDAANRKKLAQYHGIASRVMGLFLTTDSEKERAKLERENDALQAGNLKSVGILAMPGYVLQRRFGVANQGSIYRTVMEKSIELYGKKYAANKARQLLAQLLSFPIIGFAPARPHEPCP